MIDLLEFSSYTVILITAEKLSDREKNTLTPGEVIDSTAYVKHFKVKTASK